MLTCGLLAAPAACDVAPEDPGSALVACVAEPALSGIDASDISLRANCMTSSCVCKTITKHYMLWFAMSGAERCELQCFCRLVTDVRVDCAQLCCLLNSKPRQGCSQ